MQLELFQPLLLFLPRCFGGIYFLLKLFLEHIFEVMEHVVPHFQVRVGNYYFVFEHVFKHFELHLLGPPQVVDLVLDLHLVWVDNVLD